MEKNQAFSSFCFRDMVDLEILQSDWPRAFWPISQETDSSQVWNLCKNTVNNTNFLYIPTPEKKKTKVSNNFKKPYFWPIFSFLVQKNFLKKPSCHPQHHMGI